LSRKGRPNHDASLTSKAFVTSTRVGVHVANPINTADSSALEFALSSLCAASDEQYESIPDDEIALLVRKFRALHKFHKERRRFPRDCFECSDTTHFIADCPKRKKFDSSNKYNYNNRNDSSDKGESKKKYRFSDKKKKFQKMMSRACATLSDLDFFSDDSSSSEEDERPKRKTGDFIGLCLIGKSSRHISDSDSDVSDDSSPESLSLRVIELENALCNQDNLLCKVFRENKKLNLELESSFSKIASLRSAHDDMSAKTYDRCTMIMVNYTDLWLIHSYVAGLLDSARLELRELRFDLEATAIEIKDLKHKIDHSSQYTVLSPPCEAFVSLKGKLLHATKENTELQQEVAYLTARLEKTALSEKMIEEDLSQIEESAIKFTYRLGVGFERCEDKGEKSAPKFIPSFTYHKEEAAIKSTKAHYPSNPKPSFNPKREVGKETLKPREEAFIYMFCGCAGHLDEFCFRWKRIEGGVLSMLETHIVKSSLMFRLRLILIFHLARTLMLCLILSHVLCIALRLVLCFSSLMNPTIAHIILVHERIALSLDALVTAHVLIMVIVSHVGLVFPLEGPFHSLSRDTWMVHAILVVVHVPLDQVVRCKGL
jgi:hypothetical protein